MNPVSAVSEPLSRSEPGAENNVSVWSDPAFYIPVALGGTAVIAMLGMCAYDCFSKRLDGCVGERQTQASRGEGSDTYRSSSRVSLSDPDLPSTSSAPSEVVAGAEGGASRGEHTLSSLGVAANVEVHYKNEAYEDLGDCSNDEVLFCLLYTSPSPRDVEESRMPSSA